MCAPKCEPLIESGLSQAELDQLGIELSKQYFGFYKNKNNIHHQFYSRI